MLNSKNYKIVIEKAKSLWSSLYSDEYGYITEKHKMIDTFKNDKNVFFIIQMFDSNNQKIFLESLPDDIRILFKKFIQKSIICDHDD